MKGYSQVPKMPSTLSPIGDELYFNYPSKKLEESSVWKISEADYLKYSKIFHEHDKGRGYLNGETSRELLSQSGLSPALLYQVWNLADANNMGSLNLERFCVAMHLIFKKLNGIPLPLQLPPELQIGKVTQHLNLNKGMYEQEAISQSSFHSNQFDTNYLSHNNSLSSISDISNLSGLTTPIKTNYSDDDQRGIINNIKRMEEEIKRRKLDLETKEKKQPIENEKLSKIKLEIHELYQKRPIFELDVDTKFPVSKMDSLIQNKISNLKNKFDSIKDEINNDNSSIGDLATKLIQVKKELFLIEDSIQYNYNPGENQSNSFTSLNFSSGSDQISQKAAAMLAQRMQALNINTKPKIPEDAQKRIDDYQITLEKELLKIDNDKGKIVKEIDFISKKFNDLLKTLPISNDLNQLDANKLKEKINHWKYECNGKAESTKEFIKLLKSKGLNGFQSLNKDNSSVLTNEFTKVKTESKFNIDENKSNNFHQDTHNKTNHSHFKPKDSDNKPATSPIKPSIKSETKSNKEMPKFKFTTPEVEPQTQLNYITPSSPNNNDEEQFDFNSDREAIAMASRRAREKAKMFEKAAQGSIPPRPMSPKPNNSKNKSSFKPLIKEKEKVTQKATVKECIGQADFTVNDSFRKDLTKEEIYKPLTINSQALSHSASVPGKAQQALNLDKHNSSFEDVRMAARKARELFQSGQSQANKTPFASVNKAQKAPPAVKAKPAHLRKENKTSTLGDEHKLQRESGQLSSSRKYVDARTLFEDNKHDKEKERDKNTHDTQNEQNLEVIEHERPVYTNDVQSEEIVNSKQMAETYQDHYEEPYVEPQSDALETTSYEPYIKSTNEIVSQEPSPNPNSPWLLRVLYDYNDESITLYENEVVIITAIPEDNPGWCLGYKEGYEAYPNWIPLNYLELPDGYNPPSNDQRSQEKENIDTTISTEAEETLFTATVLSDFDAEIDGGSTVLFLQNSIVTIHDTSNPDWYLCAHPESEELAYLPSDILFVKDNGKNPFAKVKAEATAHEDEKDLDSDGEDDMLFRLKRLAMPYGDSASEFLGSTTDGAGSPRRNSWVSVAQASTLEGLSENEIKRREAIHELVTTEKTYLRDMQLVIDLFYTPLQNQLSEQDLHAMFSNLNTIVMVNTLFLSSLEAATQDIHENTSIAQVFLDYIEQFGCYAEYCGAQQMASKLILRRLNEDKAFANFLKQQSSKPECRMLSLTAFLLEPVQRITRYPLLLKQILKYTPNSSPDYTLVEHAVVQAEAMLANINATAQFEENSQQLLELSKAIDFSGYPAFKLNGLTRNLGPRQAVMDGPLNKHKSGRALHGFLFNDVMLLTTKNGASSKWTYSLYCPPIPLVRLKVRDAQTSQGRRGIFSPYDETCFQIVHVKEVITVKATTSSTKKKWMSEISKAIQLALQAERTSNP